MSIESVATALQVRGLDPTEKLVLIGIANHDGDGGAWPSVETLARYACVSERSVQGWLRRLESKGWITIVANAGGFAATRKDRRPNLYLLHLDGVKPVASRGERGEAQRADGVKPTAPEPSYNHPEIHEQTTESSQTPDWFIAGGYGRKRA